MSDQRRSLPQMVVTSGVNSRLIGFVTVSWGENAGQLTPDEARAHALGIIAAADATDFDAALVRILGEQDGIGELLTRMRFARTGSTGFSGRAQVTPDEPLPS